MRLLEPSPPFGPNCLSLFNMLQQKAGTHTVEMDTRERQLENTTSVVWNANVLLDGARVGSGAIDSKKQKAQSKAVLMFFRAFLPGSPTWLEVVDFVKSNKFPVQQALEQKSLLPI